MRSRKYVGMCLKRFSPLGFKLKPNGENLLKTFNLTISLTEADLADFNLECLAAASEVLNLDVNNWQSRWFS